MSDELSRARYISFVSCKKDGTPVATPVWVVDFEDGYAFTTEPNAFKVKRVRNNPHVTVQVCDFRGRTSPGSVQYAATARILEPADASRVNSLVAEKYPIGMRLVTVSSFLKGLVGKASSDGDAAIAFTLD
jgi:PPOX class probable F420-dependent enzyme